MIYDFGFRITSAQLIRKKLNSLFLILGKQIRYFKVELKSLERKSFYLLFIKKILIF